jgi:hypothetical protein
VARRRINGLAQQDRTNRLLGRDRAVRTPTNGANSAKGTGGGDSGASRSRGHVARGGFCHRQEGRIGRGGIASATYLWWPTGRVLSSDVRRIFSIPQGEYGRTTRGGRGSVGAAGSPETRAAGPGGPPRTVSTPRGGWRGNTGGTKPEGEWQPPDLPLTAWRGQRSRLDPPALPDPGHGSVPVPGVTNWSRVPAVFRSSVPHATCDRPKGQRQEPVPLPTLSDSNCYEEDSADMSRPLAHTLPTGIPSGAIGGCNA